MKPGIYQNLSSEDYHASAGYSRSILMHALRSAAHARAAIDTPQSQTEAFSIGTEFHRLLLEPESESRRLLKPSTPRRSKNDRAEWAQFFQDCGADAASVMDRPAADWDAEFTRQTGRYLLNKEQLAQVAAMSESVRAHPSASALLEDGEAEQSIYWEDMETGILCKCRPDWVHRRCIIVDPKSCEDASPRGASKSYSSFCYHVQAAFYADGYAIAYGLRPPPFVFIFCEKTPPYGVGVYRVPEEDIEIGRSMYRAALDVLAEAERTGVWCAYSPEIETINLQPWAYSRHGFYESSGRHSYRYSKKTNGLLQEYDSWQGLDV